MSSKRVWAIIILTLVVLLLAGCGGGAAAPTVVLGPTQTPVPPPPTEPPPTPAAPSTATPSIPVPTLTAPPQMSNLAAIVQAEFSRLAAGHILYNPPEVMTVGERERIEVRITQGTTVTLLSEELQGTGAPKVEQIPVTSFMKVRLTGDSFAITPLSSEEQVVVENAFTQWSWDVIPLEAGEQTLAITVIARVKLSGFSDEQKDLKIIERRINVQVNPVHSIQTFVTENKEWIYPTVLIPLVMAIGGWAWRNYVNRKDAKLKTNEGERPKAEIGPEQSSSDDE